MKIFLVLHQFSAGVLGGSERVVHALATEFRRMGHEAVVVAGSLERAEASRVDHEMVDGIPVLRLHRDDLYFESWWKAWSPGVSATFLRLLHEQRPDVVHVHHWLRTTTDFVRQARAFGAVTAVTLHDHFAVLGKSVRAFGEDRPLPPLAQGLVGPRERDEVFAFHRDDLADEILAANLRYAPSRAHADSLSVLAPRDLGEIAVSPPPHHSLPPRAVANRPSGRRLISWGALYEAKGIHVLLAALRIAKERGHSWELDLHGSPSNAEYSKELDAAASGLVVRRHGTFTPLDLARSVADFAVFPALSHESYGLVIDEAQALGWPMLVSDLPAYREHAAERSTLFFRPGDAKSLAALLCAPERLESLARPDPPRLNSAAAAAEHLLSDYLADRLEKGARVDAPAVDDARRIRLLWARAERRYWSALQQAEPPAPQE